MSNIFGNNRNVGQRGPKGKDAFDLIQWTPHGLKKLFRESEEVNIYFNTATDGVIYKEKKPIALKNRGLGVDAKFLGKKFPNIRQIKRHNYMIELQDSIFEVNSAPMGCENFSTAIFLFTFKALGRIPGKPRILFSNKSGTRAVSVEEKEIKGRYFGSLKIYSSGVEKEIPFEQGQWTGIFIQYTCKNGVVYCQYRTADTEGCLELGKEDPKDDFILYIGGHPEKTMANHAMGSFELYFRPDIEKEEDPILSEKMQKCLIKDILDRVDE